LALRGGGELSEPRLLLLGGETVDVALVGDEQLDLEVEAAKVALEHVVALNLLDHETLEASKLSVEIGVVGTGLALEDVGNLHEGELALHLLLLLTTTALSVELVEQLLLLDVNHVTEEHTSLEKEQEALTLLVPELVLGLRLDQTMRAQQLSKTVEYL